MNTQGFQDLIKTDDIEENIIGLQAQRVLITKWKQQYLQSGEPVAKVVPIPAWLEVGNREMVWAFAELKAKASAT